jgi:uncharacterized repeat protein (TIGR01451 family)
LLAVAFSLSGGLPTAYGQRLNPTPTAMPVPKPIAATPRNVPPSSSVIYEPPKLSVIATTRPAVVPPPAPMAPAQPAPVQPVVGWPDLKALPAEPKPGMPDAIPALPPTLISGAAVSVGKINPDGLVTGRPLTYEIVVRNVGNLPAYRVRVEDELPSGTQYLGGEPQAAEENGRLVWLSDTLEPGVERRYKVQLQANGVVEPTAWPAGVTFATGKGPETRPARPELVLTVAGPDSAQVGEVVVLQMKLTNTGTAPATNVLLHDRLPDGLSHPAGNEIETDVGVLGPGETKAVTLEVTAIRPGRVVNQATATCEGAPPAAAHTPVGVTGPGLIVRSDGPTKADVNGEVEYVFEAINSGTAPVSMVHLTVRLPEGFQLVSAGEGGAGQPDGRSVEWPLGSLAPGLSRRGSVKLRVKTAGEWVMQAFLRAEGVPEARSEQVVRVEQTSE